MSGSMKSVLQKQYKAAFARWPKDPLRPDLQLQDVLNRHLGDRLAGRDLGPVVRTPGTRPVVADSTPATAARTGTATELSELRQVNALFSLLDDRYKNRYRITGSLLRPASNPTYYTDLITELEEAPKRSFLGRLGKRLSGMFRLS